MARVLVLTDDRLGSRMAGPAIRACELVRHLRASLAVELASLQAVEPGWDPGFPVTGGVRGPQLVELARGFDILLAGGFLFAQHPELLRLGKYTVLDLYDPMLLEELAREGGGALDELLYAEHHRFLATQMRAVDFMICASERQRDYWLGRLCALGRLGPETFREDPSARRLLDVVPFGIPATPPAPGERRLRGVLPGLAETDTILVWGGGMWDWLDPLTPIRAIARLQARHPALKLVFAGTRSPNPTTPPPAMALRAREVAAELGVLGTSVVFLDQWVPYEERGALLLEADGGFSAHLDHLETRFSYRTRILDYLWAGLPVLTTTGDALGDLIRAEGLGSDLPPGDEEAWVEALERFRDPAWRAARAEQVRRVVPRLSWEVAIAPLRSFCQAPYTTARAIEPMPWFASGPLALPAKALLALRDEGWSGLRERAGRYLGRRSPNGARHG